MSLYTHRRFAPIDLRRWGQALEQVERPAGMGHVAHYYPAFDGVRAFAILAVFVTHYSAFPYGRLGVSVFFVLSGFLITGVLLRSRGQQGSLKTFYVRRTLRIFPLYWGFWIVVVCLTGVLHIVWTRGNVLYLAYAGNYIWSFFGDRFAAPAWMVHLGYAGWVGGAARHYLYVGHFWTLAVEEQFYLFWPVLILWPRRIESILRVCVGVIVGVIAAKVVVALWAAGFPSRWIRVMPLRCDEFAFGGAVATLLFLGRGQALVRRANWILYGSAGALVLSCFVDSRMRSALGEARWDFVANTLAVDVFAVGLILVGMGPRAGIAKVLSWRPLVGLGRISYGFYVFHDVGHELIRGFVERRFAWGSEALRDGLTAVVAFAIALGCAAMSFRFLETPFLKLKDRWKFGVGG
jgi:peptidoglycan/LPS O-acetylase OafA/YrhL